MKSRTVMIFMIFLVCGLQLYGQEADSGVNTFQKPDTFTFITIDVPGAGTGPGQGTFPFGINPAGVITGYDLESDGFTRHGFLRARDGTITTYDAPGAGTGPFQGTGVANSNNPAGANAGAYIDRGGTCMLTRLVSNWRDNARARIVSVIGCLQQS